MEHARRLATIGPFRLVEATQAVWLTINCGPGVIAALRLVEKDPHVSKVKVLLKNEWLWSAQRASLGIMR